MFACGNSFFVPLSVTVSPLILRSALLFRCFTGLTPVISACEPRPPGAEFHQNLFERAHADGFIHNHCGGLAPWFLPCLAGVGYPRPGEGSPSLAPRGPDGR